MVQKSEVKWIDIRTERRILSIEKVICNYGIIGTVHTNWQLMKNTLLEIQFLHVGMKSWIYKFITGLIMWQHSKVPLFLGQLSGHGHDLPWVDGKVTLLLLPSFLTTDLSKRMYQKFEVYLKYQLVMFFDIGFNTGFFRFIPLGTAVLSHWTAIP